MSWSVTLIGKPENVAKAVEAEAARMTGQSRLEFDEALPHLLALVRQNFVDPAATQYVEPVIKLVASGSGYAHADKQLQRSCNVFIETMYGKLV